MEGKFRIFSVVASHKYNKLAPLIFFKVVCVIVLEEGDLGMS